MPVSRICTSICTLVLLSERFSTRMSMLPLSVNLIALPTRLVMTCCKRSGSPITLSGTSFLILSVSSSPLSCDECASSVTTSSSVLRRAKGMLSRISLPASSLEKSRTSLMIASRLFAERSMVFRWSRWVVFSSVFSVRRVKPITPFSGVRSSWDMLAKNSDLMRAASCARFFARSSSTFWISICSSVSRKSEVA
ncbi:hypothetical protein SDC9_183965 [bioreactor metagenome]|uniref:Uncharacterized protein n=1 Tax=bioreactor metagenome TaxID=1076179 RepID=A0A645HD51_9ZZZZ